jgi:hypothetical protein
MLGLQAQLLLALQLMLIRAACVCCWVRLSPEIGLILQVMNGRLLEFPVNK